MKTKRKSMLADISMSIPLNYGNRSVQHNFTQFKEAVFKLYPGSKEERKWTIADMDKVVGEQLRIGILDVNDLGAYYCAFFTITTFLCNKNHLSEAEQSRAFIRISRCLELKYPDHKPDNHYPLLNI